MMGVLVVGLGSMGRRRIRILKRFFPEQEITGVDLNEERRKQSKEELGIKTKGTMEEGLSTSGIDCCFVCASPLYHADIISAALKKGLHVFSEINLVSDGYEEILGLARESGRVLFLSSTPMYKQEILLIDEKVKGHFQPLFYNYHYGQYLPDWHPWENYKDFFVGNKRSNGCRELFAIELPWLLNTFGKIKKADVISKKITGLEIDFPDSYLLQIEHENGNCGMIAFDVVSRRPVRHLEVYGEQLYLVWDGKPEDLVVYNMDTGEMDSPVKDGFYRTTEGYNELINEQGYIDEVRAFFEAVEGKSVPKYTFEEDLKLLDFLDKLGV